MGVLANLVQQAQPALYGAGADTPATAGATWLWGFTITNPDGTFPDLSAVTGVCNVVTEAGGSVIATLDFDGNADGSYTVGLAAASTASLATDEVVRARWYLSLDDGTDVVFVWAAVNSQIDIGPGV